MRNSFEDLLAECYARKIADAKLEQGEYSKSYVFSKLTTPLLERLMLKLMANREEITITLNRKPHPGEIQQEDNKENRKLAADKSITERRMKLDIPAEVFGGPENYSTPNEAMLFGKSVSLCIYNF